MKQVWTHEGASPSPNFLPIFIKMGKTSKFFVIVSEFSISNCQSPFNWTFILTSKPKKKMNATCVAADFSVFHLCKITRSLHPCDEKCYLFKILKILTHKFSRFVILAHFIKLHFLDFFPGVMAFYLT